MNGIYIVRTRALPGIIVTYVLLIGNIVVIMVYELIRGRYDIFLNGPL